MDFGSIVQKLKPFGQTVNKQFIQVQQMAREKIGGQTADTTELPPEYRALEEKVDKIKLLHENFTKVSRTYTLPHNDYQPPVEESVMDFATSVQQNVRAAAAAGAKAAGVANPLGPGGAAGSDVPRSLSHAFSRVASEGALCYGADEPMGAALRRFSQVQERVGNLHVQLDQDAVLKFHNPFLATLSITIGNAMKARRNVATVRLTYDAARARLKSARPDLADSLRTEMEAAEDEFVAAVDDAMGKMKLVAESTEPLKNLADLCAAQLAYHRQAFEALSELSPEIDELQVTNEALQSSNVIS